MNFDIMIGKEPITVRKSITDGYKMVNYHIHNMYEIYFSDCDGLNYFVNNSIYQVNKGDLLLFNNKDLHKISVPQGKQYRRIVVTFLPKFIEGVSTENYNILSCFDEREENYSPLLSLDSNEQMKFIEYINKLMNNLSMNEPSYLIAAKLTLGELLLFICELKRKKKHHNNMENRKKLFPKKLRAVQSYIDSHLGEKITLDKLARECYLNKSYLCRLFKKEMGFSINDYITYQRLSKAAEMLVSGKNVQETAYECGFGSNTYFITVFKKNIGVTPSKFAHSFNSRK